MGVFAADYLKLVAILTVDSLNTRHLGMIESAAGTDYQELSHPGWHHPQDTQRKRWNADTQWQLFLETIFCLNGHCVT